MTLDHRPLRSGGFPTGGGPRFPQYLFFSFTTLTTTGTNHQMINVGPAARNGQVVQDHPPLPLQRSQEAGGTLLPRRSLPPRDSVRTGPEPQRPASRHSRQRAEDQC